MINIVLFEPEIPQNTGNIARTCAVTGASLHLVEPLGFKIDSAKLKRAGLDYWDSLDIHYYKSTAEFLERHESDSLYFFTTKSKRCFCDVNYSNDCYLIFGRETAGIDEKILSAHKESCVRIPMRNDMRSLNLSNSVAIGVYEALRQRGFFTGEGDGTGMGTGNALF